MKNKIQTSLFVVPLAGSKAVPSDENPQGLTGGASRAGTALIVLSAAFMSLVEPRLTLGGGNPAGGKKEAA